MDKSLLARATTNDDTPTPGYLYGEIARMTLHSYETSNKVIDYLLQKVKKKQPNVKYKSLQVIKQLCREGRNDFKKEMQKSVQIIKECLNFRGPPDPLKGDEYYKRVRETAKECLDAIFDTDMSSAGATSAAMAARIQGVGSSSVIGYPPAVNNNTGYPPTNLPPAPAPYTYNSTNNYAPPPGNYPPGPPVGIGYVAPGAGISNTPAPTWGNQMNTYPNQNIAQTAQPSARIAGIGNPMFHDARDEKGFLQGLKEKAASLKFANTNNKTPGYTNSNNIAGAPPGASNPPEGWSYATNRGPTSGMFNHNNGTNNSQYNGPNYNGPNYNDPNYNGPNYNGQPYGVPTYNPDENNSYGNNNINDGYNNNNTWRNNTAAQDAARLKQKAYEGNRRKGAVGGIWGEINTKPAYNTASINHNRNMNNQNNIYQQDQQQQQQSPLPQQNQSVQPYNNNELQRRNSNLAMNNNNQPTITTESDGTYERSLLQDLCPAAGMRAVPTKEGLDSFFKKVPTLDANLVGSIINTDFLNAHCNSHWQVISKILTVVEELIKRKKEFFDFYSLDDHTKYITYYKEFDKTIVRDKAVKILSLLNKLDSRDDPLVSNNNNFSNSMTNISKVGTVDLLGSFDSEEETKSLTSSNKNVPISNQSNDIFGGLEISDNNKADNNPDLVKNSSDTLSDIFGGLQLQNSHSNIIDSNTNHTMSSSSILLPPETKSTQNISNLLDLNNGYNTSSNVMNNINNLYNNDSNMNTIKNMNKFMNGNNHLTPSHQQVYSPIVQKPVENSSGFHFIQSNSTDIKNIVNTKIETNQIDRNSSSIKVEDTFNFIKDAMKKA